MARDNTSSHSQQSPAVRTAKSRVTEEPLKRLLLTVEEAARALSIGRPKMWRLIMTREVQSVKIGASRRVPIVALEAYVGRLSGSGSSVGSEED